MIWCIFGLKLATFFQLRDSKLLSFTRTSERYPDDTNQGERHFQKAKYYTKSPSKNL